ncbi:MAG: nucleoside transporter C-terminal domain-containing protein [Bacteroidota bacterium]|nr:nucleoside transporter C-terminal domain-containing protein [Bacteroidota bacterium]
MDILGIVHGLIGLVVVVGIAFAFSNNRRLVNWRLVGTGIALQFLFAFIVLKTDIGRSIFRGISTGFVKLLEFTTEGATFVFGGLAIGPAAPGTMGFFFAFQVLPTIIFFASLMSVFYYLGIMQKIVQGIAWFMAKVLGTSGAESLSVAASVFIGQTEAPLTVRPYIATMTNSELLTMMIGGMAHISGGVMAAYVQMLGIAFAKANGWELDTAQIQFAGHLLAASVMSAPATMIIAKVLIPEVEQPLTKGTVKLQIEKTHSNVIEAAAGGASDGVKLAINVAAMLVAFVALIALLNGLLGWVGWVTGLNVMLQSNYGHPLSLELLFGLILQFVAFAIGVPWHDALNVGSLMGIKTVLNEFVAYSKLADMISAKMLSPKAITIATYALCGFANFSSIAIQIGGISPLAENRRSDIARFGLRALLGGTIATLMTATIAGILVG